MTSWWKRLAAYARPYSAGLLGSLLLSLGLAGLEALKPWPMKLIVDNILGGKPWPDGLVRLIGADAARPAVAPYPILAGLALATVVIFLGVQLLRLWQAQLNSRLGCRMVYALGADLFAQLQRLSLRFHGRMATGDLVRRVTTDSGCVRELVMWGVLPVLGSLASLIAMFVVMCRLDWGLALIALAAAFPLGLLIRVYAKPMSDRTYEQQQAQGELMALANQTLSALPIVQAFGRETHEEQRFRALGSQNVTAALRTLGAQLRFKYGTGIITATGTAVVIVLGGLHVLDGTLSLGSLLVFLAYLAALYSPLETLAYVSMGFASAAAGSRRVFEVMDTQETVKESPAARPLPERPHDQRGQIRFENVRFGYEPDRPVLHDITLNVDPGETIALVGPTGAGKSTLVSLLPRFFDPWDGRVTFDGLDLREVQLAHLRAHISLVLQEPFLMPLSVADNIAYGMARASRAQIIAAAVAANADEFIRQLPNGYDTVIGERGATLSGGEKQRLAIARALLKDAAVLIFDEPTAALDAQTEARLLEALERLKKGRTTFIITHRLSTVRIADRIVVLEAGRIVEHGTQQALLATASHYRRLYELQFGKVG